MRELLVVGLSFALYILCPRMTAMIAAQSRVSGINPYAAVALGALISVPLFAGLVHLYRTAGLEAAVLAAALADLGAAVLLGSLNLRAGLELLIMTGFVYVGIRVAPAAAEALTSLIG